jgi:uncharacterized protein (TIGR02147 family)
VKFRIFNYLDYRALLLDLIESRPERGRGERKRLAQTLGCQMAYITHVLNGQKALGPEQGLKLAAHFNFNEGECEYFLDLLAYDRAGTKELREFYLRRLKGKQKEYGSLKIRLDENQSLSESDQARYYSHWLYAAIHMASTIPALQTVEKLSRYFNLTQQELAPILEFLESKGLVRVALGAVASRIKNIYIGSDSPFVQYHHMLWRARMMQADRPPRAEDLQYSLCFSTSAKAWAQIREGLVRSIDENLQIIRPSADEQIGFLGIDLRQL